MPISNIDKRRQIRLNKFKEEKEIISMWVKHMKLLQSKRNNVTIVELPKPIRKGYVRFFILREDVAKSDDASFYRRFLPLIQSKQYAPDKKFERKEYPSKKMVAMTHEVQPIEHKKWNELNFTPKQAALFEKTWIYISNFNGKVLKTGRYVYVFKKPWMFVSKIEPHYVTHKVLIDPDLESQIQELSNKIDRNNLGPKAAKVMGWKWGWKWGWRDWEDTKKKVIEKIIEKEKNSDLVNYLIE